MGLFQPDERHGRRDGAVPAIDGAPPAVVVHSLAHAQAALQAATEHGISVKLMSAPGAAAYGGPGWFSAMADEAAKAFPGACAGAILDCADKPGFVLAAVRGGCRWIRFTGPSETAQRLAAIAGQAGARLVTGPVETIDLSASSDPLATCRDLFARR